MLLKRACALLLALGLAAVTSLSSASAAAPIDARLTAVLATSAPTQGRPPRMWLYTG